MELLCPPLNEPSTAKLLPSSSTSPIVEHVLAESDYAADRVSEATGIAIEIDIVRKMPGQHGVAVHPRRRIVKWWLARFGRHRWLTTDFEAIVKSASVFRHAASAMLPIQRPGYFV